MPDGHGRKISVDPRIDSYRDYFSDDWGERIESLASPAQKLSEIVFDLLVDWRATAYTASLPVAAVDQTRAYHDGYVSTGAINTKLLWLAGAIMPALAQRIPDLTSDPLLASRLKTEIVKIGAELEDTQRRKKVEFPIQEAWQKFLEKPAYQLSLWRSQLHAYASIYNSYEAFLVRMVCAAQSIKGCRAADKDFKKRLAQSFGETLKHKVWTNNDVNTARVARHALSHAGGELTAALSKQAHGFRVLDRRIQIWPEDVKALYALLKGCAFSLAEAAVAIPQFR